MDEAIDRLIRISTAGFEIMGAMAELLLDTVQIVSEIAPDKSEHMGDLLAETRRLVESATLLLIEDTE